MTALLLCLALQETRVTLDVADEPLGVAAILALAPFGDQASWPAPPWALRRVSFRLRDAGYLETLDTLGELAGFGRVLDPSHTLLLGSPNECVTYDSMGPPLRVLDLTPSVRLLAWTSATREASTLDLFVIAPPGTPQNARFQGRALQVDFKPFLPGRTGDPVRFSARAALPRHRTGDTFTLDGALSIDGGRPLPIVSGPLPFPPIPGPSPAVADPPPPPLGPFLIAGLTAGGLLLFLWFRLAFRRS